MANSTVKRKFPFTFVLVLAAAMTAALSWAQAFPKDWVEMGYSRLLFPTISHIAGFMADAIPISWLDVWLVAIVVVLVGCMVRRNWRLPLSLTCAAYLIFFWGWGLNYHRRSVEFRLGFKDNAKPQLEAMTPFIEQTAHSLNRLWPQTAASTPVINHDNHNHHDDVARLASERVRRVISHLDGVGGRDWTAASRIKHSYLADWWFRIAGIDGMFNPFAHEPLIAGGIPDFELPFLMSHELAHVYGIADEGDANFVAFLATVASSDPKFEYSAAFEMWLHLGAPMRLLDPGPKQDLQAFYARVLEREVRQATRLQSALLNSQLKANGVHEGVKSYSNFVALAVATRDRWEEFQ